jgi:hypothetical protein
VGGLQVAEDGLRLEVRRWAPCADRAGDLRYRIADGSGAAVTRFRPNHERRMHLVLVARDLSAYQHVHPLMAADGTWWAPVMVPAAGPYRAFAAFWPAGRDRPVTLGVDLAVPGRYLPRPLPPEQPTVVVDGYAATLDGCLRAGEVSRVGVRLRRDGQPVTDPQPHLGAYGHLVALRDGDLAYLHVRPAADPVPGPAVAFAVGVPSAGTYRLFFEFRHDDVVRTAGFTATAR